jgi:alkylated DNA repair dioxygenase AlkB
MTTATLDLFSETGGMEAVTDQNVVARKQLFDIPGLDYMPDFVSADVEQKILQALDQETWLGDLERRVQHYGYKYNYKSRRIDETMRVGELPSWLVNLGNRMVKWGVFEVTPDQVIVNEYLPGQGITSHIDCEPCFGDTVASLSLGSGCYMDFTSLETGEKLPFWLERRSLVVLKGDSRYCWQHGIAKRKKDVVGGSNIERTKRISLTFRKVISMG